LKIDFKKAFDKVDYNAIIFMMKAKEFGRNGEGELQCHCCHYLIDKILNLTSTSVLLNGILEKYVKEMCTKVIPYPLYYL
jgi:hypothetical protein